MKSHAGLVPLLLAMVALTWVAAACGGKSGGGGRGKGPKPAPDAAAAGGTTADAGGATDSGNGSVPGTTEGGTATEGGAGSGMTGGSGIGTGTGTSTTTSTSTTTGTGTTSATGTGAGTSSATGTGTGTSSTSGTSTTVGTTTGSGGTTSGGNGGVPSRLPETAGIQLVAVPSAAEGCVVTAAKTLKNDVTADAEHFFFFAIDDAASSGKATLRVQQNVRGIVIQSAWIEASAAVAAEAAARLGRGEAVKLASDPACAVDFSASAATLKIAKLTLFPEPVDGPALNGLRQTLEVSAPRDDGALAFSAVYGYDGQLSWQLSYETKISDAALAALPDELTWNVYDKETLAFVAAWKPVGKDAARGAQFSLGDRSGDADAAVLKRILPHQARLELILDAGPGKPRLSLPIGDLCKRLAPEYFIDLTHADKRCFEVKDADIP